MQLTVKQAKGYGTLFFILLILFFIGTAVVIFEPLQAYFINHKQQPNFFGVLLFDLFSAFLSTFLTYYGFAFSTLAYQKWTASTAFKWTDGIMTKNFWICYAGFLLVHSIVLFWWRSTLP